MNIDDELQLDEQQTRAEKAFIRQKLNGAVTPAYIDDGELLEWLLDATAMYYCESGVFESGAEEVSVDMDEVANYVCSLAEQEGRGALDKEQVKLIAEADLDFMEQDA
jgi:hypothetical protein